MRIAAKPWAEATTALHLTKVQVGGVCRSKTSQAGEARFVRFSAMAAVKRAGLG